MGPHCKMVARSNRQCDQESLEFDNKEKTKNDEWIRFYRYGKSVSKVRFLNSPKIKKFLVENHHNHRQLLKESFRFP